MKNNKVIIPIIVGIIIVVAGIIATSNQESNVIEVVDTPDTELILDDEITAKIQNKDIATGIQKKYDEIEKGKLENKYTPKPAEWITSGPFQVDRSEYILGEKVFVRIGGLGFEEKGQIAFLRPLNSTHYSVYLTIPFDGANKPAFNYYFEPALAKFKELCTVDDLIGDWRVVFQGTDYANLEFKITKDILPGAADKYEPVC